MHGNISPDASWRDSARAPKLFVLNANATFPLVFFLLHIRLWTFIVAMVAMVFFTFIQRYGFTLPVFGRWVRALIAGPRKVATPWWL